MRAEPLTRGGVDALPDELAPRRLARRLLQVLALIILLVLVALLAPGLGEVRRHLADASLGWLAVAVAFEA
ncbi:MAG: putative heme transporter, partial [Solirubrobacteraceae bacterium]|nr:putative heme transporter [Solirubrobacteraceae bacterium]